MPRILNGTGFSEMYPLGLPGVSNQEGPSAPEPLQVHGVSASEVINKGAPSTPSTCASTPREERAGIAVSKEVSEKMQEELAKKKRSYLPRPACFGPSALKVQEAKSFPEYKKALNLSPKKNELTISDYPKKLSETRKTLFSPKTFSIAGEDFVLDESFLKDITRSRYFVDGKEVSFPRKDEQEAVKDFCLSCKQSGLSKEQIHELSKHLNQVTSLEANRLVDVKYGGLLEEDGTMVFCGNRGEETKFSVSKDPKGGVKVTSETLISVITDRKEGGEVIAKVKAVAVVHLGGEDFQEGEAKFMIERVS